MTTPPEAMYALLKSLGAQLEALRLAVYALAGQADGEQLLHHYDAGAVVLRANQQGKPLPDDYLAELDHRLDELRRALAIAAPPGH